MTVAKNTPLETCLLDLVITSRRSSSEIQSGDFLNIFLNHVIMMLSFYFDPFPTIRIALTGVYKHFHS